MGFLDEYRLGLFVPFANDDRNLRLDDTRLFACNLVAIVLLSRQAVFLLKDYRQQKKEGKNPVFTKDKMPEIADKLEAW